VRQPSRKSLEQARSLDQGGPWGWNKKLNGKQPGRHASSLQMNKRDIAIVINDGDCWSFNIIHIYSRFKECCNGLLANLNLHLNQTIEEKYLVEIYAMNRNEVNLLKGKTHEFTDQYERFSDPDHPVAWLRSSHLLKRDALDHGWQKFRRLPILVQLMIGLLALPLVIGLWVWQTRWPFWLRLTLVAGLAWITLYTFFPQLPLA
jgi:hypothetical protein